MAKQLYTIGIIDKLTGKEVTKFNIEGFDFSDAVSKLSLSQYADLCNLDKYNVVNLTENKLNRYSMKRNNKALYEKIMRNVSKQVKKALNEEYCAKYPEKQDLVDLLDETRSFTGDQMVLDEIIEILSYDELLKLMRDIAENWGEGWFDEEDDENDPENYDYGPLG